MKNIKLIVSILYDVLITLDYTGLHWIDAPHFIFKSLALPLNSLSAPEVAYKKPVNSIIVTIYIDE